MTVKREGFVFLGRAKRMEKWYEEILSLLETNNLATKKDISSVGYLRTLDDNCVLVLECKKSVQPSESIYFGDCAWIFDYIFKYEEHYDEPVSLESMLQEYEVYQDCSSAYLLDDTFCGAQFSNTSTRWRYEE